MTNSEIKEFSKKAIQGNIGMYFLMTLIYSLLIGVSSFLSFLVAGAFTLGICAINILIVNQKKFTIETLFIGFNDFLRSIIAFLLVAIYTFLWSLLIIPAFIKPFSYSMTFYIMNDNKNLTADEAITESRKLMDGNKMRLFLLNLSFIGWILLSIITFGIAMIYVLPYMQTAQAKFYEEIKKEKRPSYVKYDDTNTTNSTNFSQENTNSVKYCPFCGAQNTGEAEYCAACGKRIKD